MIEHNDALLLCKQYSKLHIVEYLPYARDKTAVDLFHFSLFCLWCIREGGLFS